MRYIVIVEIVVSLCLLLAVQHRVIVNAQERGSLRLVGGSLPSEGRLEVYINGEWGTVCDDLWDYNDLVVACRQLGYSGVIPYLISIPGNSSQRTWLTHVGCLGTEGKLIDCNHRDYAELQNCVHREDVGVRCQPSRAVQLIGGNSSSEGHVEVYYNGRWHSVCGSPSAFGAEEATTVCRQLGYNSVRRRIISYYRSINALPSDRSFATYISCSGSQSTLSDCDVYYISCNHSYRQFIECSNSDVRLVGGSTQDEGSVELYYDGQWRSVCVSSTSFGNEEGVAFCRQLGYNGVWRTSTVHYTSEHSAVDVSCFSKQWPRSLNHCNVRATSCPNSNGQFVVCGNPSDGDVRLVGGSTPSEGRVEVYYNGQWRSVCGRSYSFFEFEEASTVCSQLGHMFLRARSTTDYQGVNNYTASVSCRGRQNNLTHDQCFISMTSCSVNTRQYVSCTNSSELALYTEGDVRLVGSDSQSEGWIELLYKGQWWTVCGNFGDIEGNVVCGQLGYAEAIRSGSRYKFTTAISRSSVSILCHGGEKTLLACSISETSSCNYPVAVICSNSYIIWAIIVSLVSGLVVLCVLCLICCVAYKLYRKKKNSAVSTILRPTSETIRFLATETGEQAEMEHITLNSSSHYKMTDKYSTTMVGQEETKPSQQFSTSLAETVAVGTESHNSLPEWTANPASNLEPLTGEYRTLQSATDNHEPLTEGYSTLHNAGEYEQPFFGQEVAPTSA